MCVDEKEETTGASFSFSQMLSNHLPTWIPTWDLQKQTQADRTSPQLVPMYILREYHKSSAEDMFQVQ